MSDAMTYITLLLAHCTFIRALYQEMAKKSCLVHVGELGIDRFTIPLFSLPLYGNFNSIVLICLGASMELMIFYN